MDPESRRESPRIHARIPTVLDGLRKGVVYEGSGGDQASHLIEEAGLGGVHSQRPPPATTDKGSCS